MKTICIGLLFACGLFAQIPSPGGIAGGGGSSGGGPNAVTSTTTLTDGAFATGSGNKVVKTPSATSTLDASGNAVLAGTMTTGGGAGAGLITTTVNSIGVTLVDGLVLKNDTAATSGNPQYSPGLLLRGTTWNSGGTVSQNIDWDIQNRPANASDGGQLHFLHRAGGGTFTSYFRFTPGDASGLSIYPGLRIGGSVADIRFASLIFGYPGDSTFSFERAVEDGQAVVRSRFSGSPGTVLKFNESSTATVAIGTNLEGLAVPATTTLLVKNNTDTSGVTLFAVRAGDGQSTNNLQEWQTETGTVVARVSPTGGLLAVAESGSNVSACNKYTLTNNGTNWTVNGVVGAAIAANTTQSVTLFALPTRGKVQGITEKTTTAWSGTGFTSFAETIGDSVGGTTFYSAVSYDLDAAVGNTNFQDTALFKSATFAGSNVQAVLTANQNLNTNTITGVTDIDVCWVSLP